jgi:hypothetical protein
MKVLLSYLKTGKLRPKVGLDTPLCLAINTNNFIKIIISQSVSSLAFLGQAESHEANTETRPPDL